VNTYTEQLSGNEWDDLTISIWPCSLNDFDNFKYDLPYPLPCRVIYKLHIDHSNSFEVTYNENGNPHSFDNNPAIIINWLFNTHKYYMDNGKLHNTSGLAYVCIDIVNSYALDGIIYESFDDWVSNLHNYVSNEDILAIKLKGEQ